MGLRTELGKIKSVRIGCGGYQEACFGISFNLGNDSWGVCDFWGTWETRSGTSKYSKEDWENGHLQAYLKLIKLMAEAKVKDLSNLEGIPVEVTFKNFSELHSWRILTEVL